MTPSIVIAFVILLILIFLNVPIYASLLAAGVYLMVFVNRMPLTSVFTVMFEGITKNSLLAIPFFMLAGNLISRGTLGSRLMDFCSAFLKNRRGGIPIACLIANAVFGAISGSPPAATAIFSRVVHKPMAESDGEQLATGLVTSAAGLASIIPPSVVMIIYGISTDTSVSEMFLAGILPGICLVILIGIYLVIRCKKKQYIPTTGREIVKVSKQAIPVLILPVLVLGGIYGGIVTPTEAGALSAVYCFVVSVFVLREIRMGQIVSILKDSLMTSGQVFLLIAASAFFARALTISQLPQWVTLSFGSLSKGIFMLLLIILLLVVGCFFDPSAAILILAPMLLPAAIAVGIDPIHLGIVFTVTLSVGMFTPPFGLNIFIVQSVLGYDMKTITRSLIPFILIYLVGIVIVAYVPALSTVLLGLM